MKIQQSGENLAFFLVSIFIFLTAVQPSEVHSAGRIEIVSISHANTQCTGTVDASAGTFYSREDAPSTAISNPAVYGDALPWPDGFVDNAHNYCFQVEYGDMPPSGGAGSCSGGGRGCTGSGYFFPHSYSAGSWHVGSGISPFSPSVTIKSAGYVSRLAYGINAATFEYQYCTDYIPPQCSPTGGYSYTNFQSSLACSGGTVLHQESHTINFNDPSPDDDTHVDYGGLCRSLNATCCSVQNSEVWWRGEPQSQSSSFAAYGPGSSPTYQGNSGRTTYSAMYQYPEQSCTPASGGCTPVPAPSATLTANPTTIQKGSSSTLTWSSINAQFCSSTKFSTLGNISGTRVVSPTQTTSYPLVCTGYVTQSSSGSGGSGSGAGTWQYDGEDLSDLYCVGGSCNPNNVWEALPNCPSADPEGTACTGSGRCKINEVQGTNVVTTLYQCSGGGGGGPTTEPTVTRSVTVTVTSNECSDGIDNDGDGRIDSADYGCTRPGASSESPNPACSDGADNDNDGKVDHPADTTCSGPGGSSEGNPVSECSDGIDNNNNGLVDVADTAACSGIGDTTEEPLPPGVVVLTAPDLVRSGSTATISWELAHVRLNTCSLNGTNGDSLAISAVGGSRVSPAITAEATYTLSCIGNDGKPVLDVEVIRVVPRYKEF